ncbi:hypothetical protein [Demequina aurantiaca]|uniref:hypothetical protein n=1 Tax=Demequina aurantiaca TaxID=676200 RepID=UPI003D32EFCE
MSGQKIQAVAYIRVSLVDQNEARQVEGITLTNARGTYARATELDGAQVVEARRRIVVDGVSHARVARDLGISRPTLYSALRGVGRYASTGVENTA